MKSYFEKLLEETSVDINGDNPWDIQVHDDRLFSRLMRGGTLSFGESYMDEWWDAERVDQLITRLMKHDLKAKIEKNPVTYWLALKSYLFNLQRKGKAKEVGEHHYDAGNDLFEMMLDEGLNYSSGYWKNADTLEESQDEKLRLICEKLQLEPGMDILDIGCGWGGFAEYAAKNYDVNVIGITISEEQAKYARERTEDLNVDIRLKDYRDLSVNVDRVVSIGMFEHVGYKNYEDYFEVVRQCLKKDTDLFLLHTIGGNRSTTMTTPWFDKYIFPNGMIPSIKQVGEAIEDVFIVEDFHNYGPDYDKTLMEWHENFQNDWDDIKDNYSHRFKRMWEFYLLSSAAAFRSRHLQNWEWVLSPEGVEETYRAPR